MAMTVKIYQKILADNSKMTNKEVIIQLYRDENTAMVAKNIETLNKILPGSKNLTHVTGYVRSKLEWDQPDSSGLLLIKLLVLIRSSSFYM